MLAHYESAVQGKGAWGGEVHCQEMKIIYEVQININNEMNIK